MNCLLNIHDIDWLKKAANRRDSQNIKADQKSNSLNVKRCLLIKFKDGFSQVKVNLYNHSYYQ